MSEEQNISSLTLNRTLAVVLLALSAFVGISAFLTMPIGTLSAIGPGFFPVLCSVVLAMLSVFVAICRPSEPRTVLQLVPFRRALPVLVAPIVFGVTIRSMGMVVAVFLAIFIASIASRHMTLRNAAILSVAFTAFCVIVFNYFLRLPIPIWGSMLRF